MWIWIDDHEVKQKYQERKFFLFWPLKSFYES